MRVRVIEGSADVVAGLSSNAPLRVGSAATCELRISTPGIEGVHLTITAQEVTALAECTMGGVVLRAGARRLFVDGALLQIGAVVLALEDDGVTDASTLDIVSRHVAKVMADPLVTVVQGPAIGRTLALRSNGAYRVGRGEDCDLAIDDPELSRAHVELVLTGAADVLAGVAQVVTVRDLDSRGGTHLGSSRLAPRRRARWKPDRMLRVGGTVLSLRLPRTLNSLEVPETTPVEEAEGEDLTGAKGLTAIDASARTSAPDEVKGEDEPSTGSQEAGVNGDARRSSSPEVAVGTSSSAGLVTGTSDSSESVPLSIGGTLRTPTARLVPRSRRFREVVAVAGVVFLLALVIAVLALLFWVLH